MADPSRWASLNESEREVLRAATAAKLAGFFKFPLKAYVDMRLSEACEALTDDPPATEAILVNSRDLPEREQQIVRVAAFALQRIGLSMTLFRVEAVNG